MRLQTLTLTAAIAAAMAFAGCGGSSVTPSAGTNAASHTAPMVVKKENGKPSKAAKSGQSNKKADCGQMPQSIKEVVQADTNGDFPIQVWVKPSKGYTFTVCTTGANQKFAVIFTNDQMDPASSQPTGTTLKCIDHHNCFAQRSGTGAFQVAYPAELGNQYVNIKVQAANGAVSTSRSFSPGTGDQQ